MTSRAHHGGFTLIELSIGLVIIVMLLGSLLVPLRTQVEIRKTEQTQRILDQARDALLGYVAARGYFPCPASSAINGDEPPTSDHVAGTCPSYYGFLPAVPLGFTSVDAQGYAVDAWGLSANRIRYAISSQSVAGVANALTRSGGMVTATIPSLGAGDYLYVCASGTGVTATDCGAATNKITSAAVAVIWSLGPNAATGGTSVHESKNLDNDTVFVNRPRSDISGAEFDDILTWVPVTVLISRMVAVGQLP